MPGNLTPILASCPLFKDISIELIEKVTGFSEYRTHHQGDVLIHKGNVPAALFVVISGKVRIFNEDVLLAESGPLSVLGESFLADATASATIVAGEGLETIEIPKQLFYKLS